MISRGSFTHPEIAQIEGILNRFPEVEWDRMSGKRKDFVVFGWIKRDDKYKDFILLGIENFLPEFISTSSAKYSELFNDRLGWGHDDCIRVEDIFENTNHIKL